MRDPGVACARVVGPSEGLMAHDSLESDRAYYPNADIWIVDDCTTDGTYECLARWTVAFGARLLRISHSLRYVGLVNSVSRLSSVIAASGIFYIKKRLGRWPIERVQRLETATRTRRRSLESLASSWRGSERAESTKPLRPKAGVRTVP